MLIVDAHLDISMNALDWNRNLDLDVYEIRKAEAGMTEKGRGHGTTSLPEFRKADVGVAVATVICRTDRPGNPMPGVASQELAYAWAQGQLAYYRVLVDQGKVRMIADWPTLEKHVAQWEEDPENTPLGFILAMEGADPVVWPEQVEAWWDDGLRMLGPAHYGLGIYSHGTTTEGGLTQDGERLLEVMDPLGMILDLSHLAEEAFWQALDQYQGPVVASHNNCRALVPGDRQFSDEQIEAIVERDGVIGVALDAWMLYPRWIRRVTPPSVVTMEAVADQIDHICQVAGNADHVAIGSDLDGGFGIEQCPYDLDTIADLQKIPGMLRERGYSDAEIEGIMHGNWLSLFKRAWS
jgi:membrane dipeptidase